MTKAIGADQLLDEVWCNGKIAAAGTAHPKILCVCTAVGRTSNVSSPRRSGFRPLERSFPKDAVAAKVCSGQHSARFGEVR